jgi:hypothetical protein
MLSNEPDTLSLSDSPISSQIEEIDEGKENEQASLDSI